MYPNVVTVDSRPEAESQHQALHWLPDLHEVIHRLPTLHPVLAHIALKNTEYQVYEQGQQLTSNFVLIRITDSVFLLPEIDVSFVGSFGGCTRISGWKVNMWEIASGVTVCTPAGSPV